MIKAIFFDLDDTLENWMIAKNAIRDRFCGFITKKYGLDKEKFFETFVKVEYEIVGRSLNPMNYKRSVWIKEALKRFGVKTGKSELKKLDDLYWKIAFSKIRAYPDTIPTLRKLRKYKKIIVTDSDGDKNNEIKNRKISKLKLRKYFDLIVTSNETGRNKPDKKMWRIALKKFKLKPSECIMVGDKPEMDLKPAKEMGFATVWMRRGDWASRRKAKKFKYVDYEISRISDLLRIL
jgi:putative hydrolase of the HAD superfamily